MMDRIQTILPYQTSSNGDTDGASTDHLLYSGKTSSGGLGIPTQPQNFQPTISSF